MCRVMAISAGFAGPKVQKATVLFGRLWPEKFGIGLDLHIVAECGWTNLAASCRHIKERDVRLQKRRAKCYVMIPGDRPIEGCEINCRFFAVHKRVFAVE